MPFPPSVREEALVRSGRRCCVCHKFAGRSANVHHIRQEAKGGANTLDNAICLCPTCHEEAGHYNAKHPLGIRYSPRELLRHRDRWWRLLERSLPQGPANEAAAVEAFALELLGELNDPSLWVLSALGSCPASATVDFAKDPVPDVHLVSQPRPQIVEGAFDWTQPVQRGVCIPWPWLIVQESVRRLRGQDLLHFQNVDARGGFGNVYLSERGQTLVRAACFPREPEASTSA
jgi:hypothetical protein